MSSPNILSVNSGPLIIRTYNNLTSNNTYLLNKYDYPISSNYILITSANGQLIPTSSPTISSITIGSTITGLQISRLSTVSTNYLSTPLIIGSTIENSGSIYASTLNINGPALFRNTLSTITVEDPQTNTIELNSDHFGKYLLVEGIYDTTINLPPSPPNGTNITIRNIMQEKTVDVNGFNGGPKTLQNVITTPNTISLIANSNIWYSLSNF
jgi:hypothetical protein